jgi:peroxiredoxin
MNSNKAKARFVVLYPVVVLLIAAGGVAGLVFSEAMVAWSGALLTVAPFIGLYVRATRSPRLARTSHRLPVLTILTALGGAVAIYGYMLAGPGATLAVTAAAVGVAGFFLFDFWYSSFGRTPSGNLAVGGTLPDFGARDLEGRPVRASDMLGRPALYMFYRGNWCPFCMAQVREIMDRYRELADLGAEIVLVSPQATELTQRVASLFDVPCRFWVDEGLEAAGQLGIRQGDGVPAGPLARQYGKDTVYPTVIITDENGKILFADQTDNYRVRPEPAVFLRVLQAHGFRPDTAVTGV